MNKLLLFPLLILFSCSQKDFSVKKNDDVAAEYTRATISKNFPSKIINDVNGVEINFPEFMDLGIIEVGDVVEVGISITNTLSYEIPFSEEDFDFSNLAPITVKSNNCLHSSLKKNRSCKVALTFKGNNDLVQSSSFELDSSVSIKGNVISFVGGINKKVFIADSSGIEASPLSLVYGEVNKTSLEKIITVKALVDTIVSIDSFEIAPFVISSNNCPTGNILLKKNRNCTIQLKLNPDPELVQNLVLDKNLYINQNAVNLTATLKAPMVESSESFSFSQSSYSLDSVEEKKVVKLEISNRLINLEELRFSEIPQGVSILSSSTCGEDLNKSRKCVINLEIDPAVAVNGLMSFELKYFNSKYAASTLVTATIVSTSNSGGGSAPSEIENSVFFYLSNPYSTDGQELSMINKDGDVSYFGNSFNQFKNKDFLSVSTYDAGDRNFFVNKNSNEVLFIPNTMEEGVPGDGLIKNNVYKVTSPGQLAQKKSSIPSFLYSYGARMSHITSFGTDEIVAIGKDLWIIGQNSDQLFFSAYDEFLGMGTAASFKVMTHNNVEKLFFVARQSSGSNYALYAFNGLNVEEIAWLGSSSEFIPYVVRNEIYLYNYGFSASLGQKLYKVIGGGWTGVSHPGMKLVSTPIVFKDNNGQEYLFSVMEAENSSSQYYSWGKEFFIFDGTNWEVKDLLPGSEGSLSITNSNAFEFKGKLVLKAKLEYIPGVQGGSELIIYDPTIDTSSLVSSQNFINLDLDPGMAGVSSNRSSNPLDFYISPDKEWIYFTARKGNPAVTTTAQTTRIMRFNGTNVEELVATSSSVLNYSTRSISARPDLLLNPNREYMSNGGMVLAGNKLYYRTATIGSIGTEFAIFDLTDGSLMFIDMFPGTQSSYARSFYYVNGMVYFAAKGSEPADEYGSGQGMIYETYPSELTSDILIRPATIFSSSALIGFMGDVGHKIMMYSQVYSDQPGSLGNILVKLYSFDYLGEEGNKVSKVSGPIDRIGGEFGSATLNGEMYYVAYTLETGNELFKTDGTSSPQLIVDLNPGMASGATRVFGKFKDSNNVDHVLFAGGAIPQLYLYSGEGTPVQLTNFVSGDSGVSLGETIARVQVVGNNIYFLARAATSGFEMWISDGTSAGTRLLKDINPATNTSKFIDFPLVEFNGKVYFRASNTTNGYELWETNGTEEGTNIVSDLNPGTGNGLSSREIIKFRNKIFFSATQASSSYELWSYDGTTFKQETNLATGTGSSSPNQFVVMNDKLYFSYRTTSYGQELASFDGENVIVHDLRVGIYGSNPTSLFHFKGKLYFLATTGSLIIDGQSLNSPYRLYTFDGINFELVPEPVLGVYTSTSGVINYKIFGDPNQ